MPVITCPKCPTQLKIPDGAKGSVRCPKCGAAFPAAAPPKAAPSGGFEVVDDDPPKPAAAGSKAAAALPKTKASVTAAAADEAVDFEVVDEDEKGAKPKTKARAVAADDDDEAKQKQDRDAGSAADANVKKKKRRDDDHDVAPEPVSAADRSGFAVAESGARYIGISLWLYIGTFVYLVLVLALAWAGVAVPNMLIVVAGLLGLANWTLGLIGCTYCLAGPARARGPAAAALALTLMHVALLFSAGGRVPSAVQILNSTARADDARKLTERLVKEPDANKQKDLRKELEAMSGEGRGGGDAFWQQVATQSLVADQLLANLCYESKGFSRYLVAFMAGLLELLRVVFVIRLLGAVARAARDNRTANKALLSWLVVLGATLAGMVVMLIVAAVLDDSKGGATPPASLTEAQDKAKRAQNIFAGAELLLYLIHAGGLVMAALLALGAKGAAARRA